MARKVTNKDLLRKTGISSIYSELTHKSVKQAPKVLYKKTVQDSIPIYAVHEAENLIETYPGFFTRQYYHMVFFYSIFFYICITNVKKE